VFQILGSGLNLALWRALVWWFAVASLTLSWTPSVTPGVKSQWVRCGLVHGGPYTKYAFHLVTVPRTSHTFKVAVGIPLFCVVTAVSGTGVESGASNEIKISP
jgi:hypothetical protein